MNVIQDHQHHAPKPSAARSGSYSLKRCSNLLTGLIKTEAGKKIAILIGILLMALIFLSSFLERESKPQAPTPAESLTMEAYVSDLELRVSELLSKIKGVGDTEVMITLESGAEYIYQSEQRQATGERNGGSGDQQRSKEKQENIVMVEDEAGKKQALIRTERTPTVQGIVVVCDGGGDLSIQAKIIDVLTSAFSIPSHRVSVAAADAASSQQEKTP